MAPRLTKAEQARDVPSLRKVIRLPAAKAIKDLLTSVMGYRRRSGDNSERIRKLFASAVTHGHVHKPAALLALRFAEMDEGKRAILLAHFDDYREKLGLDKIRQGALDLEPKKPAAEPAAAKGNGRAQVDLEELTGKDPPKDPPRTETLVDPASLPSRDEVKAAADRAEQLSKAKSTLPLN